MSDGKYLTYKQYQRKQRWERFKKPITGFVTSAKEKIGEMKSQAEARELKRKLADEERFRELKHQTERKIEAARLHRQAMAEKAKTYRAAASYQEAVTKYKKQRQSSMPNFPQLDMSWEGLTGSGNNGRSNSTRKGKKPKGIAGLDYI